MKAQLWNCKSLSYSFKDNVLGLKKIPFYLLLEFTFCGLYYKHIMIINDDTSIINKFEASLTDEARVVIYDHHMFIVQAIAQGKYK